MLLPDPKRLVLGHFWFSQARGVALPGIAPICERPVARPRTLSPLHPPAMLCSSPALQYLSPSPGVRYPLPFSLSRVQKHTHKTYTRTHTQDSRSFPFSSHVSLTLSSSFSLLNRPRIMPRIASSNPVSHSQNENNHLDFVTLVIRFDAPPKK